jgi:glucan 1,3-beta-glucosidase
MIALSLLVPMLAGGAVARSAPLASLAVAINPPLRRQVDVWSLLLAIVFAATLVAAIHVALGLVFDPRYKDFQLALLTGPVVALAIVTLATAPERRKAGMAERVAAGLLIFSALFVMFNEGIANWQALWFGALLVLLALTAFRAAPAPG